MKTEKNEREKMQHTRSIKDRIDYYKMHIIQL